MLRRRLAAQVAIAAFMLVGCDHKPQAVEPRDEQVQTSRPNIDSKSTGAALKPGEAQQKALNPTLKGKSFLASRNAEMKIGDTSLGTITFLTNDMVGVIILNRTVAGTYKVEGDKVSVTLPIGGADRTIDFQHNSNIGSLTAPTSEVYDELGGKFHTLLRQTLQVRHDARIYEAAVKDWAIENNKCASDTFKFSDISDYIRAQTTLIQTSGKDILGNQYVISTVGEGVKVNPATSEALQKASAELGLQ